MNSAGPESGFTLVEILVALTIFVLSGAALYEIVGVNLDRAATIRDRSTAALHAQSLLAQSEAAVPLRAGVQSGAFPDGFRWRIAVSPFAAGDAPAQSPVTAMTIEVQVSWREGARTETRSLRTLRVVSASQPP